MAELALLDSLDVAVHRCVGGRAYLAAAGKDRVGTLAKAVVEARMRELRATNRSTQELGIKVGYPEMGRERLATDVMMYEAYAGLTIFKGNSTKRALNSFPHSSEGIRTSPNTRARVQERFPEGARCAPLSPRGRLERRAQISVECSSVSRHDVGCAGTAILESRRCTPRTNAEVWRGGGVAAGTSPPNTPTIKAKASKP